jgi:hypothetical protein
MGLDTPTPTGSSSASSQQSQPPSGFDPFAGDGPSEPKKEEALGADDSFPEDLNGLEGIGPLANLTNTSGPGGSLMDAKVEVKLGGEGRGWAIIRRGGWDGEWLYFKNGVKF